MPSSRLLSNSKVLASISGSTKDWLAHICVNFKNVFVPSHGYAGVDVDPKKVHIALKSWIDDLDKHAAYHRLDPNPYKLAAHLMFSIAKAKPIFRMIPNLTSNYTEYCSSAVFANKHDWINELFAFELGLYLFGRNISEVDDETAAAFVYLFCFRDVNPKHLALTLEQLDRRMMAEETVIAIYEKQGQQNNHHSLPTEG
jgi:hypothetical protein